MYVITICIGSIFIYEDVQCKKIQTMPNSDMNAYLQTTISFAYQVSRPTRYQSNHSQMTKILHK